MFPWKVSSQNEASMIGGVAANAQGYSELTNSSIKLTIQENIPNPTSGQATHSKLNYVGGAYARYDGNSGINDPEDLKGISNSQVKFNMKDINFNYVGGLLGYAKYIKVENSKSTGQFIYTTNSSKIYLGGLIGYAEDSLIARSGTEIKLIITVAFVDDEHYIGAIAGYIKKSSKEFAGLDSCYYDKYTIGFEETTENPLVIGIYGKNNGAEITNCGLPNEE